MKVWRIPFSLTKSGEFAEQPRQLRYGEQGGMFKADPDADTFSQIQSIAQTAKKNNQNPFLAILAVANYYWYIFIGAE